MLQTVLVCDGSVCRPPPTVLNPDNTFEVLVDQTVVNSGSLLSDMTPPVNPPAEIEDPDDQKPEDWDERPKIQDPSATKPEDWSVHRHQRDGSVCSAMSV